MNRFLESKLSCFDQLPVGLSVRLMPQGQGLLSRVKGGPHVFADPLVTDGPRFIQELDMSSGVYFTHEVNPSRRNGQVLDWNQAAQVSRQSSNPKPLSHLCWCLALQDGRLVNSVIPARERWGFGLHVPQTRELFTRPEASLPQTMEGLNLVIALGLVKGSKDRFDPAEQTQPHDAADHTRVRMPTTKGCFVVELLHERQPQIRPCFQEMRAGRGTGFVGVLRQMHGMAVQVNRVKVVDLLSAIHIARDNSSRKIHPYRVEVGLW